MPEATAGKCRACPRKTPHQTPGSTPAAAATSDSLLCQQPAVGGEPSVGSQANPDGSNDSAHNSAQTRPPTGKSEKAKYENFKTHRITSVLNHADPDLDYVQSTFENKNVISLVDNGASVCTLDFKAFPMRYRHIRPSKALLLSANNTKIRCVGTLFMRFKIGVFEFAQLFYVVRNIPQSCILGRNFLVHYGFIIDYASMKLSARVSGKQEMIAHLHQKAQPAEELQLQYSATGKPSPVVANSSHSSTDSTAAHTALAVSSDSSADNSASDDHYIHQLSQSLRPCRVYPQVSTTIPAHAIMLVPLRVEFPEEKRRCYFNANISLAKRGIIIPEGLVTRTQLYLPVSNVNAEPFTLTAAQKLGHLSCDIMFADQSHLKTVHSVFKSDDEETVSEEEIEEILSKFDVNPKLDRKYRVLFAKILKQFSANFVTEVKEVKLMTNVPPVTLRLKEDKVVRVPTYKLAAIEKEFIKTQMLEMEEAGLARESSSPYRNPIIIIRKSDGSMKAVQDFRRLNTILDDEPYSAEPIESLLEYIYAAKYFVKLDFKLAFNQTPLTEESKKLTAFSVPGVGTYELNGLAMGIKSAPSHYANIMEYVFGNLKQKYGILTYYDDCLLYATSVEDLLLTFIKFMEAVQHHNMSLSAIKCSFGYQEIDILGVKTDGEKFFLPDNKIEILKKLKPPKDKATLSSLVGTLNYLRKHVPRYSHLMKPVMNLLKQTEPFEWTETQQKAMDTVVKILLENKPLYNFDPALEVIIHSDASNHAAGACFLQRRPNLKKPVIVEFFSRLWQKSEVNWPIFHKEFASATYAIKFWRHRVLGKPFTLLTDSKPLASWQTMKNPQGRLAKFCLYLSQFSVQIKWIPGQQNFLSDCCSRSFDIPPPVGKENMEMEIEGCLYTISCTETKSFDITEVPLNSVLASGNLEYYHDSLASLQAADTELYSIMEKLKKEEKDAETRGFSLVNGVLMSKERYVVPKYLHNFILHTAHDDSGHFGTPITLKSILNRNLTWPSIYMDVQSWCRTCEVCQTTKHAGGKTQGMLEIITSQHPMDLLIADYIGPLKPSGPQQYKYILIISDVFSRFVFTYRTKDCTAQITVSKLKELFLEQGVCRRLYHDAGTNFCSKEFGKFLSDLNIIQVHAPRYAHWSVGLVEKHVGLLKALLVRYCAKEKEWAYYLKLCTFFLNSRFVESIRTSPFHVWFGRQPLWPSDLRLVLPKTLTVHQLLTATKLMRKCVFSSLASQQRKTKTKYDKNKRKALFYRNQMVLVLRTTGTKFGWKKFWYQKAKIVCKINSNTYLVRAPRHGKLTNMPIHVRHIKAYYKRPKFEAGSD